MTEQTGDVGPGGDAPTAFVATTLNCTSDLNERMLKNQQITICPFYNFQLTQTTVRSHYSFTLARVRQSCRFCLSTFLSTFLRTFLRTFPPLFGTQNLTLQFRENSSFEAKNITCKVLLECFTLGHFISTFTNTNHKVSYMNGNVLA